MIDSRVRWRILIGTVLPHRRTVERRPLPRLPFANFKHNEPGDAEEILCHVAHVFAFFNPARDAIDGFVGVIFGKRTAAPFEESS